MIYMCMTFHCNYYHYIDIYEGSKVLLSQVLFNVSVPYIVIPPPQHKRYMDTYIPYFYVLVFSIMSEELQTHVMYQIAVDLLYPLHF